MTNVVLHPDLAQIITRAIVDRQVASDMIDREIKRVDDYSSDRFQFWRGQHVAANKILWDLGIKLVSFDTDLKEVFK